MLSKDHARILTCGLALMGATSLLLPATARSAAADANVETVYTPHTTSIGWVGLGQNAGSSFGSIGPFTSACAIVEGQPTTSGSVTTRNVYVLDAGDGSTNGVVLNVFSKTDTITTTSDSTSDSVAFTLSQQVSLTLASQAGAVCYMAANDTSVFAGTSANNFASIINKSSLAETTVASTVTLFNDPVTQISATSEGKVLVTFGTGSDSGWALYDDQTNYLATGQFYNYSVLANTVNATTF